MRTLLLLLTGTLAFADDDAAAIMTKVATNVEKSTDARRQVYKQSIISNLVRSNGKIARKENREYQVFPTETGSEKKLVTLEATDERDAVQSAHHFVLGHR